MGIEGAVHRRVLQVEDPHSVKAGGGDVGEPPHVGVLFDGVLAAKAPRSAAAEIDCFDVDRCFVYGYRAAANRKMRSGREDQERKQGHSVPIDL